MSRSRYSGISSSRRCCRWRASASHSAENRNSGNEVILKLGTEMTLVRVSDMLVVPVLTLNSGIVPQGLRVRLTSPL
jgi:hypothetical protein